MGREQDLERQMQECRKAKETLLSKTGDAGSQSITVKAKMWDAIYPFIRTAVENKIKDGSWPVEIEFRNLIYDKAMTAILGEGYSALLAKL